MKKILLTLSSASLLLLTLSMVSKLDYLSPSSLTLSIIQGWMISMQVTGIVAFLTFAFPMYRLLPKSYFEIDSEDMTKKIFDQLKVDWFQRFLLATIWRNNGKQKRFFSGGKQGLELFEQNSKNAEFGHLIPFILLLVLSVYVSFLSFHLFAAWIFIFNVFGNLYPIFLQRQHRSRISNIKKTIAKRSKNTVELNRNHQSVKASLNMFSTNCS